ncbi:MAG: Hpt domain-containing protein [Nitrospinales bacterium]
MNKNNADKRDSKIIVAIEADLKTLIPKYLNNRQKDIRSILENLDQGNFEAIRNIGHMMNGSGRGYGFNRISQIGVALEQGGQESNSGKIRKSTDELADYLNRIEIVFE